MNARALLAAMSVLAFALPFVPAGAQQSGAGFELDLDRSTFFELSGRNLTLGFAAYNFMTEEAAFTLACSGAGVTVSPARTVNISAGGRFSGNFSVAAAAPGSYDLSVTMKHGNETARGLALATFLPPLSARFVSPAANGRVGVVGAGQPYTGAVNLTNFGATPLSPTFTLPARDLRNPPAGTNSVTLQAGEVPAGATRTFTYEGMALPELGTRNIAPVVKAGGLDIAYGFEVLPDGVANVTALGFTLAARELLGVELSEDRFALGKTTSVTLYVESRLGRTVASASLDISARSDIRARNELNDYAAEERFEEFTGRVESGASFTRHYDIGPMSPGVQQELRFDFTPKICRASSAGGSYFLDFRSELGGVRAQATKPIAVLSPLELSFDEPEKVSYRELGAPLMRTVTVRNVSNATISGASASFFLDYKEKGFVRKADIAGTPATPLPSLAPGDATVVRLEMVPRSAGTYTFFPVIEWGGLMVYGSHIQVVASAPESAPVGPYVTAALAIIVPVALTRKLTPG
jgi:hypothetical protein